MGNLQEELGRRIRTLREAAGLSQPRLAARAGMDYKFIGGIERGERNITVGTLERILKALNIQPHQLWTGDSKKPLPAGKVDVSLAEDMIRRLDSGSRQMVISLIRHMLHLGGRKARN